MGVGDGGAQVRGAGVTAQIPFSMVRAQHACKPFWYYFGGKWRNSTHYPKPEHSTIIEPFAGAAGYSVRYADHDVILIDVDEHIAETWRYLIEATEEEILALPDLPHGHSVDTLDVCQSAKWLIGWWLNHGTTSPRKRQSAGGLRLHALGRKTATWNLHVRERIASQLCCIRHWVVAGVDYMQAPNIEATWFIDPPYQVMGKHYRHGNSGLDYRRLAAWCKSRKGQVIVCEAEGADWLPFRKLDRFKSKRANANGSAFSHEVIWTNDA